MRKLIRKIKNYFFPVRLSQEALEAYYYKLPEKITVEWKRDGNFIIGEVNANEKKFITQGKSSDDFVRMVNDAIYTVYEIPLDYIDAINKMKAYSPKIDERKRLDDLKIKGNIILLNKNKQSVQTA
ncbi:MAG: hypothetical protein NTZ97_01290 [Candidatus Moranbacteria bacterium]|nr:hypothetical protein [Candidatus Moranbacteria bacterium]